MFKNQKTENVLRAKVGRISTIHHVQGNVANGALARYSGLSSVDFLVAEGAVAQLLGLGRVSGVLSPLGESSIEKAVEVVGVHKTGVWVNS